MVSFILAGAGVVPPGLRCINVSCVTYEIHTGFLVVCLHVAVRCDQTAFLAEYEVDTVAFQHETILQRFRLN